ncbi:ABC transporter permease [Desulfobulbus alkaliphilus]|uniref:ABC transporter permease n=1 Tax=Desulfobulbus alkaliphilus TaxID=869814 RepID=UPI00196610CC|nr:ABC transporter permease [Desulfobulbus alkaliphilus]MBM9537924.1 ABC transporter permease [Desulfobulbus alkaliphilus]
MVNIVKIAFRNLRRYQRRTLLTSMLITLGVVAVLLFLAVSGSFKNMMIGQITDSMLGHLQIHQRGYMAAIDTLPLDRNLDAQQVALVENLLSEHEAVEAFSTRIKLGALFSNYTETTNIRLNGVEPDRELRTVPLLLDRVVQGDKQGLLERGEIVVPELLARGMNVGVGDGVVLVATNRDGSVNGQSFVVRGIVEGVTGPGGRDGFIHIEDARSLLRLEDREVSEIAVRLKDRQQLEQVMAAIGPALEAIRVHPDRPVFEVHAWERLTPFANIARMIDLMTVFIKVMLVAIVLVSIMNVMVMAVYERINEIGTIAAIGTGPGKIHSLFLVEGLLLGVFGTVLGVLLSLVSVLGIGAARISFDFGQQKGLILDPILYPGDIITTALIVVAIAVLGSLHPAWKAAKMDPITALRHV